MAKPKESLGGNVGVDKPSSTNVTDTLGSLGVALYGGYIYSNERDPTLADSVSRNTLYSANLVNISIVGAGVRFFLNMIANATWTVTPSDDESLEAEEYAEILDDILNNMNTPWKRVVRRAAMYKFYGFSVQEWTAAKRDDGVIGLLDVEPRSNATIERWDLNLRGDIMGVIQRNPQDQADIYLPREKIVYLVDDALSDSPEGLGIFRHIVSPARRLQRYEQLEGYGYESDLRGIPIARAPLVKLAAMKQNGEISEADFKQIVDPIRSFVSNHIKNPSLGLVLDSSSYTSQDSAQRPSNVAAWDVELLKGASDSQDDMNVAINRVNHEIARLIGVEHLLLGADGSGTQALSRDKSDNFFLIIDSALSELAEGFNRDLINAIWEMNAWPDDMKPHLTPSMSQFQDPEAIAATLSDLASAGAPVSLDDKVIDDLYELMGLSKRDLKKVKADMAAASLLHQENLNAAKEQTDLNDKGQKDVESDIKD